MLSAEERMDLDDAVDDLTERQWHALLLVCYHGYTQQEAADTLGICQSSLNGRIMRAKKRIETKLDAGMR